MKENNKEERYNKEQLVSLLKDINRVLSEYTTEYPGLISVVKAASMASQDPTREKGKAKVKPVTIEYSGKDLFIRNTPFPRGPQWKVSVAIKEAFNALVGRKSNKVNPETGQPYFLTTWDKKAKAFRIPVSKEEEVKKIISENGLSFETN